MDTNVTSRNTGNPNSIDILQNADWTELGRKLSPRIDERLLFRAFSSTITCWLSLALLLRVDKSALKLPYGRRRKVMKLSPELKFRYFTHAELESIYFLVLLEFFTSARLDRLARFQEFVCATRELRLSGELRAIFSDLNLLFADSGGLSIQKKLSRTRSSLVDNGFSHIRMDFITGQIRLCPITKDFDPKAALYMSEQPQKDNIPQEAERPWIDKFGPADRGFFEIPLDKRVYDFHQNVLQEKRTQHMVFKGTVKETAPKHGIIALPLFSSLMASEGFSFVLFDQDRKSSKPPISKSKKSAAESVSPKTL